MSLSILLHPLMHPTQILQYRKIYALEPDVENCKKIQEYVENQKLQNIQLINAAVGKENRTVSFDQQGTAGSSVKGEGNNSVKLVCLDDVIADPVTFLISFPLRSIFILSYTAYNTVSC